MFTASAGHDDDTIKCFAFEQNKIRQPFSRLTKISHTSHSDITRENSTAKTKMTRNREHHNYGGGNQFNIESIVLNVNAPSRFGIASSAATTRGEEDEVKFAEDRIDAESSPFESEEYDYEDR